MSAKTVLVTGANGFIGYAVCRAFSLAGWTTYGLMRSRSEKSVADLIREEVTPIIGSPADPSKFISTLPAIDVIVSCTEDLAHYEAHFNEVVSMIKQVFAARPNTVQAPKNPPAGAHNNNNNKPLVIFTSGCKDYGTTLRHGEQGLAPHTEESPLNPPPIVAKRCEMAVRILNVYAADLGFDCVVTRPTTLYGRSSSFYAQIFQAADQAKTREDSSSDRQNILTIPSTPNSILHGAHVDDVAAAYVALATAPRHVVAGQAYNISAHRYETLEEIMAVVGKVHGVKIVYGDDAPAGSSGTATQTQPFFKAVVDFPQWVGSDKLRRDTGWTDKKPLFHEAYQLYRNAFNLAVKEESEQFLRAKKITTLNFVNDTTQWKA